MGSEEGMGITSRNRDRRETEYWLQEALEKSLFHRFCTGAGPSRALILHGRRARGLADFALLDANRTLTLVEVKCDRVTQKSAPVVVEQLAGYVDAYAQMTLATHADRYCRHNVGVASWFEYGAPESLIPDPKVKVLPPDPKDVRDYGRLVREGPHNFYVYRAGANDPNAAWSILEQDYTRIVEGTLDGLKPDDRLKVSRCILIAAGLDEGVELGTAAGIPVEFWRYQPPADWIVTR